MRLSNTHWGSRGRLAGALLGIILAACHPSGGTTNGMDNASNPPTHPDKGPTSATANPVGSNGETPGITGGGSQYGHGEGGDQPQGAQSSHSLGAGRSSGAMPTPGVNTNGSTMITSPTGTPPNTPTGLGTPGLAPPTGTSIPGGANNGSGAG